MQVQAIIRPATRRDIPAVVALWEELMDFHQVRDPFFTRSPNGRNICAGFLEENIRNDNACVLVAVVDDQVVGYCQGMLDRHPPALAAADFGQVFDFGVTADYRRRGIGEQLFRQLCDWFRREGIRRVEVRHSTCNEIAARFWPKMGFQPYLQTLFLELPQALAISDL
ncbi:MAG: GNAT family N-acetyltransferase [Planctomycetes bacterium]|jgi:ribosomal protein S18 acetylase RimI-like enzyme|nr:GNAT family N-acetyltransferase [Planctomycetota bacterium]